MKKLLLAVVFWGVIWGNVEGQSEESNASVNFTCPSVYVINPDTTIYLYFDTISNFHIGGCYVSWCGENIIRFTAQCTNNYVFEMISGWGNNWFPVSYKTSALTYCDSTGYTCLTPFSSVWNQQQQLYYDKFYVPVIAGVTYDILIDYACANPTSDPPQTLRFLLSKPHVSNVQFYDITPDSISVLWDGTFDDMVIEYGPKDFIPGSDTIAGVDGIIIHNPTSPYSFTGLVPDSVYDFYFRDRCGTYSANSQLYRHKTALNSDSLPVITCNSGNHIFFNYGNSSDRQCAWDLGTQCGCPMTSPEKIWSFTPDTSGIYTIYKAEVGMTFPWITFHYKEASLGCNEHNWNFIGCGCAYCSSPWAYTFGPLNAGTKYYLMINGSQDNCGSQNGSANTYFQLVCPYTCYTPSQPFIYSVSSTAAGINYNYFNYLCNGNRILEYGLAGFTPGTDSVPGIGGTILYNVSGLDTITGLQPGSAYDFYLREFCDTAGVFSDNSVVRTVTTLPLCSTAPTSINPNTNDTICSGQSLTLTQVGGVLSANGNFYWYADSCGGTSLGTGYSKTFSPTVTTTYYVRAEDSCGVTACASVTMTVNPSPSPAITGNTTICQGSSTTLITGAGYSNYAWSTGSGLQTINVSIAGTYTVTVTDANGCSGSASATVTVNPLPIVNLGPDVSICAGNAVQLSATGFASYLWSTGANTSTINVGTAGTYTVTVTDVNGCTGSDNVTVTVLPLPTAMMTGTSSICVGQSTNLVIAFTGTGPWNYAYNTPQGVVNAVAAFTPVSIPVNPSATFNYTMSSVSNSCQGTVSGNALITVNPLPAATIIGNANICIGSSVSITMVFTGTPPFMYSYTDGSVVFGPFTTAATSAVINVAPTVTTVYTLTNSFSDANCQGTVSGSAIITVNSNPFALITPSSTVFMCSDDIAHFTANTGAGYMYQWYKNSIAIAGAVNSSYDATANGLYSFVVTDLNGCFGTSASTQVQIICQPADTNLGLRMGSVSDNDIVLVPNPASTEITIHSENVIQGIAIYDAMGQKVFSMQLTEQTSNFKLQTSNFPDGIYFVEVTNGKEKTVKKFIKN